MRNFEFWIACLPVQSRCFLSLSMPLLIQVVRHLLLIAPPVAKQEKSCIWKKIIKRGGWDLVALLDPALHLIPRLADLVLQHAHAHLAMSFARLEEGDDSFPCSQVRIG